MQTNSDLKPKSSHKNNKRINRHKTCHKPNTSVRPTHHLCAERLACKGAKPEAHYICRECKTYQCRLCEELLHENPGFDTHSRQPLVVTADQLLCDNGCQTRNLADVECVECCKRLCFICDQSLHSSPNKRKHQKIPIVDNRDKEDNEEFYSCQYVSTGTVETEATEPLVNIDLDIKRYQLLTIGTKRTTKSSIRVNTCPPEPLRRRRRSL
ncbi:unnamed protein product [Medioppia subpectinata]|uniref:B box-type domain-containing protein n=1 Tax=Medioppia subpectinata TaxID=1979941 RepID=A0A7R9KIA6_9ACAR|nr:unnamed protein product [Medioppia subpectinata]CAG2103834.1 unnamed protein product [Medioppia subpectinata]